MVNASLKAVVFVLLCLPVVFAVLTICLRVQKAHRDAAVGLPPSPPELQAGNPKHKKRHAPRGLHQSSEYVAGLE